MKDDNHDSSDFWTASGAKRNGRTSFLIGLNNETKDDKEKGKDHCASDSTPDRRHTDLGSESACEDVPNDSRSLVQADQERRRMWAS